jgi:hypothetical protein
MTILFPIGYLKPDGGAKPRQAKGVINGVRKNPNGAASIKKA